MSHDALPAALRSLRSRDFRAFFGAQTLTQIATYMQAVAETWLVLSLTSSPLGVGGLAVLVALTGARQQRVVATE